MSKDRCQESNVLSLFKTISIARLITWLSFANPANHIKKRPLFYDESKLITSNPMVFFLILTQQIF
ncbi:hypothetical protein HSIEG1_1796 [Enterococcus sp. HSIEG1]|nr:predicted protein [Enterococcus gallinarum EG2]EQC79678.1 hypothetical protein HSIEG1_1796 [Enterococcus sp. HSIEG1]